MSNFDIHSVDMRVVQNRKKWLLVPLIVLVLAIVAGVVYGIVFNGAVFNAGTDLTGGYTMNVRLGSALTEESQPGYEDTIRKVIEAPGEYSSALKEQDVDGLTVRSFSVAKDGADKELKVVFTAPGYTDEEMFGEDGESGILDALCAAVKDEVRSADDPFGVNVVPGEREDATMGTEMVISAVCGALIFLALMLIYLSVRYDLATALILAGGIVLDVLMTLALMCIFHVEMTAMFFAAVIAVMAFSLVTKIPAFDLVRGALRSGSTASPEEIANTSVRDSLVRTSAICGTGVVSVAVMTVIGAIMSVSGLVAIGLPLIFGFVSSAFTAMLLAPSVWAMWKNSRAGRRETVSVPAELARTAPARDEALESFFAGDENVAPVPDAQADEAAENESPAEPGAEATEPAAAENEAVPVTEPGETAGVPEEVPAETSEAPAEGSTGQAPEASDAPAEDVPAEAENAESGDEER